MSLGVFDIGGTTVKHGIWEHQQLSPVNAFPTPVTFDELLRNMAEIIRDAKRPLTGIAISASAPCPTSINGRSLMNSNNISACR